MKRILGFIISLILVLTSLTAIADTVTIPEPTLSPDAQPYDTDHPENLSEDQLYAASAILMTEDKGEVIFEKDAYALRYPASTTKILTVLLGITLIDDLNRTVTVSDTAVDIPDDATTMGLSAGEEIKFIDVLYGTMLLSGNDGANVIAETVSGNIQEFVNLMNRTALAYGCENTHFVNAHGYHDDNHYTTAYDMALITRQAMKNDVFREIASTTEYVIPRTNIHRARSITTTSEYMLTGTEDNPNKYYYPYATGVKTGTTSDAGYCYVGAASKEGVNLISVVYFTGKRARWADTIKMMNYGFSQYVNVTPMDIYNLNPITIETSAYSTSDLNRGKLELICQSRGSSDFSGIVTTQNDVNRMASNLNNYFLIQYTRDFIAPITSGEQIGTLTYFPETGEPVIYDLVASRSVDKRENAPKTLEQIITETYADPNPFPPFSFSSVMNILIPFLLITAFVLLIRRRIRKNKRSRLHVPKPVSRHI